MSKLHLMQMRLLVFAFLNVTTEFVRIAHAQFFREIETRRDEP